MNNPTVILNGDQVYCDELIRENARLTIQHEVDQQKMEALERQIEDQAANIASLEAHSYAREDLEELADLRRTVDKAIKDLHFVMAGGDPCKVCAKVCMMGEGNCQPVWTGEKTEDREIEMDKRRLQELEVKALPGSQVLTGMPHTPGVKDKVGEYAAEIADLRGIIEAKHQQCLYERSRLERYISSIDDSLLRQIFTYRFVNGLPWRQVAACIGGGNTEDGCRKAVKRYLERN